METIGRTYSDIKRQKSTPRPLTSEDILKQANSLLTSKPKDPTMTAVDYRNFLKAHKDLLATHQQGSLLPRRTVLPKKFSENKTSGLLANLRHTPSLINKPQIPARSQELRIFEDSKQGCIEDYIIGKLIGTGAYASVKSALLKSENKKVALKIYEKYRLSDPSKKKNVSREIEILRKLIHSNIVKLFEVVETPKQLHLVLEYIPGGSLGSYLKKKPNKRLEEEECKYIYKQIVHAISYIHSQKVTHRDLKLENLLINESFIVKIIDFGFSTCFSHEKKVKIFCGTPTYMAPEIVTRKEYSGPPADVWALGILLYVMLAGVFPFRAPSDRELFKKIEKGIFSVPNHVPNGAKSLIHKILNIDPQKRPEACEIIQDAWLNDLNFEFPLYDSCESKSLGDVIQKKQI